MRSMKPPSPSAHFDPDCSHCERLHGFLQDVKREHPGYYCRPVPSFGDKRAKLLVVGLAPGKHGANATGRPFTGDHAGILLYQVLHEFGFASHPESRSADDPLTLQNCRITNAVKCLPPQNKPITAEIRTCGRFLAAELAALPANAVILALGSIAHNAVLWCQDLRPAQYKFQHGSHYRLPSSHHLLSSYHCSRYNTQTRRLTEPMFRAIFRTAAELLEHGSP